MSSGRRIFRNLRDERTQGMLRFDEVAAAGKPKGAMLTHRNILNNGYFIGQAIRLTEQDRVCIPVPLYHRFGMVLDNLACITPGATMVYPAEVFDSQSVLETVQAERCTALYGVPDAKYCEELCAWIRRRPGEQATEEEMREYCRGRIAHYKIPRYVRFVDAFPMTITGKIQKFVMRKQMIEELGLQAPRTA